MQGENACESLGVAVAPKKTYSKNVEKYMFIIVPILMTIVVLLYRLNESSTNQSSSTNQRSYTGQGHPLKINGEEIRCGYCSVRMPRNMKVCLNCADNDSD
jgi:hypothetical protein